jgi:ligand-binding sensor domain-containing protein/signal transduction histidine kinase/AraC-like DNA-binding protein
MKSHIQVFLLFIFSVLSFQVFSQTGIFYSTDKELSNSLINTIYQDKRNYIWIATEDGLNKYDGVKFTIYKSIKGDPNTIINNYVRTLFEDSSGRFWVGFINGLMLYNRTEDTFKEIKLFKNGVKIEPHVTSIIESNTHQIWITTDQGLLIIKSSKDSYQLDSKFSGLLCSSSLLTVFQDSRKDFWILSDDQGLNRYSPTTKRLECYKSPNKIGSNQTSAICEDHLGNIFVGTLTSGLFKFNRSTNRFDQIGYASSQQCLPVKCLLIDRQKNLLVGTDGMGMKIYNPKKNLLENIEMQSSLFDFSKLKIHSVLQDRAGNLWTGIFQKGVYFAPHNPNKFSILGYKSFNKNIIGSSCVMSILKDNTNTVWVGTDNDGIYGVENGGKVKHYSRTAINSVSSTIMCIFQDSNHDIWLGSYLNGLSKFNKNNGLCTYYNQISPSIGNNFLSNKVMCITEDKQKNLWIGTNGAGLYSFDLKSQTYKQHYAHDGGHNGRIVSDGINCVLNDRDGFIWIGTFRGVCRINPKTTEIVNYTTKGNILPGTIVYAMAEDHKGNIWIGTTEGLACYNKKKNQSQLYTMADGMPCNVICGILEDAKGNIWLSTHMGISKLIVAENKFVNYYAFDGLQGNEFTKSAAFHAVDDEMYFGGISGITHFYPQKINDVRKQLKVYLTELYILDVPVLKSEKSGKKDKQRISRFISDVDTIHLTYKDNMFSLEFSTFDFGNSERISYRYKMEGLNSQWMNTEQGVSRINFTNISYGTYKLKVRACIQENMSPEKEILIIISPPWYLSWWAKTFYFILFLLLGFGITKYILNQIEHKQEMMRRVHAEQINEAKLQFFINISHEIRTPMTLIISPLEKLISENTDKEKQHVYLMMYRNAQRILRLINQLMDIRKIDKGLMVLKFNETDLVEFVDNLMQTFEYQAMKHNIRFAFEHAESTLPVWIDQNNFDKVLLNIFSNAFKYTPENGEIIVKLQTGKDDNEKGELHNYFELIISDSGIGLEEEKIERIFERFYQIDNDLTKSNFGTGIGLHLAHSLVELQHGKLFARNKKEGMGSEFIVRLPLGNSHLSDLEMGNAGLQHIQKTGINLHNAVLYDETGSDETIKVKSKTNYRILIVEDEDEIRQYIRTELSGIYKIFECSNGKEALDFILKEKPNLVISDVMMPDMDGITLCKKIKSNININHIPVILLTAKSTDEDKAEGFEIGADAYVVKPFNVELLKKRIANLIENRGRLEVRPSDSEENQSIIKQIVLRSNDEILLEKIMKIINNNIAEPELNVEMLAGGVGMSRVHMHRKLKELTNQSARDFIRSIRLKQAAEMLTHQKLTISDVAYAVGFSNLSHFSNSFHEFYGMSPKEYAQRNTLPKAEN